MTSTMCMSIHPLGEVYTLPSGERATETSAFPGEVSGVEGDFSSILSVSFSTCWLAFR